MKIGVSGFAWTSRFERAHLELLPWIKSIGIDGFEVPMFEPDALPIKDIRNRFESNGLECTVCAILPKEFNPISPQRKVRQRAIGHLTRCVEATAGMGGKILCGPLFAPIGYLPQHRPTKNEWMWAVEAFQALEGVLDATDMTLSIEPVNRSETIFLRTVNVTKQLCEVIGNRRIGITLDTFHANIEERSISKAVLSANPHLKHIHLSENDRGLLGHGHIPFKDIIAALKQTRYTGYLMIEGFGYSPTEMDAPGKLWADQDISPEEFTSNAVRFLRSLLLVC